jgi:hypothetical protein
LYKSDDVEEINELSEELIEFKRGVYSFSKPALTEEQEKFIEKLEKNKSKEFRATIVEEDLSLIMKHIVEYEKGKHINIGRENFIEFNFKDKYVSYLAYEVNECYKYGLDGAVCALSRRLIENYLIEFYRRNFENTEKYFNSARNQPKTLNQIKKQFQEDLDEFKQHTPVVDEEVVKAIEDISNIGNHYIHNSEINEYYTEKDVERVREDIRIIVNKIDILEEKMSENK